MGDSILEVSDWGGPKICVNNCKASSAVEVCGCLVVEEEEEGVVVVESTGDEGEKGS